MALTKVNYIDNETAITADQMNAIQDEIIANSKSREYGYGAALPTVEGSTDEEFLANIEALCAEKIKMTTFQAILYPPGEAFDGNSFMAQIFHNTVESNGNKYIKIKAHGVTTTSEFQRVCYGSTWNEPEWDNPPMKPGVEYRTTERWNGKAVYVKLVDCGAMPNNTYKTVDYVEGAWNVVTPVSAAGMAGGQVFPTDNWSGSSGEVKLKVSYKSITIATNLDISGYTGLVTVRYMYT